MPSPVELVGRDTGLEQARDQRATSANEITTMASGLPAVASSISASNVDASGS